MATGEKNVVLGIESEAGGTAAFAAEAVVRGAP